MNNLRIWLFRFFILGVIALILVSWFLPWWICDIPTAQLWVEVRPWGLEHNLGIYSSYIEGSAMPVWFAPFMWTYLGLVVVALLFSMFTKEKEIKLGKFNLSLPHVIIGLAGFSYIVVAIIAAVFISIRTGDFFGVKLIGHTVVDLTYPLIGDAYSKLLPGYWLVCSAGILCLLLAIFRKKITGKS